MTEEEAFSRQYSIERAVRARFEYMGGMKGGVEGKRPKDWTRLYRPVCQMILSIFPQKFSLSVRSKKHFIDNRLAVMAGSGHLWVIMWGWSEPANGAVCGSVKALNQKLLAV